MPREFFRHDRVAAELRRQLAFAVQSLNDADLGDVTVSDVEVSRDLAHAKVFVNVRDENDVQKSIKVLNHASGHLRRQLGKRMRMRQIPALHFQYDDTLERGARIDELLDQIRQDRED